MKLKKTKERATSVPWEQMLILNKESYMNNNFIRKDIKIENLLVNPDNARFYENKELSSEPEAIEEIVKLNSSHVVSMGRDIAISGLNPNEQPIVIPHPDYDDRYIVMEGNRRLTSLKLMTQYKNKLKTLNMPQNVINVFSDLKSQITNVYCVVYEDEALVNVLLEKLHTSKPGISRVRWDPLAQDNHKFKSGGISRRYSIVELLKYSSYTTKKAREILDKPKWITKLRNFTYDKYIKFFGIEFTSDEDIVLILHESEVIKALSQFIIDLSDKSASEIAQTESARYNYLHSIFPSESKPDVTKLNHDYVIFDVKNKKMIITKKDKNELTQVSSAISAEELSIFNSSSTSGKKEVGVNTSKVTLPDNQKNNNENVKTVSNNKEIKKENYSLGMTSTDKRSTLIDPNEQMDIKNLRTKNLYEELQKINCEKYINVTSLSLRSLLEFSVNCFLENKHSGWAYNSSITLIEKVEKVYSNLEGIIGSTEIKLIMPMMYEAMDEYRKNKKGKNFVTTLNVFIHSQKYHPDFKQIKVHYDNLQPFLFSLWQNLNND